jgi:5-methylcytosine-specific restriction endonuclease McrA
MIDPTPIRCGILLIAIVALRDRQKPLSKDSRDVPIRRRKKRDWFDRGAAAYALVRPEHSAEPIYPCPLCLTPFTVDALADGRLSSEHVPPESVGGRELVLTCKHCNNSAGSKLDADAGVKELVRSAMDGRREHRERVKATVGDLSVNAEVHLSGGGYSLIVPPHINKPGTADNLKTVARPGSSITVQYRRFSELGAKISWFRAGYLALFAVAGYAFALDPAMEIVRRQILECDERRMVTFTSEVSEDIALSVHRILRVRAPDWHSGWAVEFGRYFLHFPSAGDMGFYDRMATCGSAVTPYMTTYEYVGWPTEPTFGCVTLRVEQISESCVIQWPISPAFELPTKNQ